MATIIKTFKTRAHDMKLVTCTQHLFCETKKSKHVESIFKSYVLKMIKINGLTIHLHF